MNVVNSLEDIQGLADGISSSPISLPPLFPLSLLWQSSPLSASFFSSQQPANYICFFVFSFPSFLTVSLWEKSRLNCMSRVSQPGQFLASLGKSIIRRYDEESDGTLSTVILASKFTFVLPPFTKSKTWKTQQYCCGYLATSKMAKQQALFLLLEGILILQFFFS